MHSFRYFTLGALAITSMLYGGVHLAHAQEPNRDGRLEAIDLRSADRLPSAFVTDVVVDSVSGGREVVGSFTLNNQESYVLDGLHYSVQLLGERESSRAATNAITADTAPRYDRVLHEESISVLPGSTRSVDFTYTAPHVPLGDYRLRIRAVTSQGQRLGWSDTPIRLGIENQPFALFQEGPIVLSDGTTKTPSEGPNLNPGSVLSVQGIASLQHDTPLTVTPTVTVYDWDITGESVYETSLAPVTLQPNAEQVIEAPLIAQSTPGAYHVVMTLQDEFGNDISTSTAHRYVTRGVSAKVVTASFTEMGTRLGDRTVIQAQLVGPADRESSVDGTVEISLLDGDSELMGDSASVTLNSNVQDVSADFVLERNVESPGFRVRILDGEGNELDSYRVTSTLTKDELTQVTSMTTSSDEAVSESEATNAVFVWVIGGIIAVLLVALTIMLVFKRSRANPTITSLLLFSMAAMGATLVGELTIAHANGINVHREGWNFNENRYNIIMFINQPIHDREDAYDPTSIPVEFDLTYPACGNRPTHAAVDVRHSTDGKKYDTLALGQSEDDLRKTYFQRGCPSGWHCFTPRSFSGSVSFGESFDQEAATLQVDGEYWLDGYRQDPNNLDLWGEDVWNLFINLPERITEEDVQTSIDCTSGQQEVHPGDTVSIRATLTDESGTPLASRRVSWSEQAQGGSLSATSSITNSKGIATVSYSLPFSATSQAQDNITATYNGKEIRQDNVIRTESNSTCSTTLSTVVPSTTYESSLTCTTHQNALPGDSVRIKAKLTTQQGTPLVDHTVSWDESGDAGTLSTSSSQTNANGVARVSYQIPSGSAVSSGTVSASYPGISYRAGGADVTISPSSCSTDVSVDTEQNRAPIAEAGVRIDGNEATQTATVQRGVPVDVSIVADSDVTGDGLASRDPNGWRHDRFGMSAGGFCFWNSDLNQGTPTFDRGVADPQNPSDCTIDLGTLTFWDEPGTYTYQVLQLQDTAGARSDVVGSISVAVVANEPTVNLQGRVENGELTDGPLTVSSGEEVTLTWETDHVDECTARSTPSGSWSGTVALNDSDTTSPTVSTVYTLRCSQATGTVAEDSLTVTVEETPQCSDSRDNDGDGLIDCADPGCWTEEEDPDSCDPTRPDESHTPGFDPGNIRETE